MKWRRPWLKDHLFLSSFTWTCSQHNPSQDLIYICWVPQLNISKLNHLDPNLTSFKVQTLNLEQKFKVAFGTSEMGFVNCVINIHYKKSFDPWRNSHDVFWFRHRSHRIHDKQSNFVIDSQCWIWSPIWSPNTMTLRQFRHIFRHRSHCIHDNHQILSWISSVGYEVQTLWRCTNFVIIRPTLHFNISSWSIHLKNHIICENN
jgi:hypothetical protein